MSTSSRFLRFPVSFSCVAAVIAIAAVGCGGRSEAPPSSSSETNASQGASSTTPAKPSNPAASKECSDKACGVDCTPTGSDEPFNCNSAGQCVATGQALGCKACPEFLGDCIKGEGPADLDGDGCIDGCKPVASK